MTENYEILKEFYRECREYSLHEVIERWSGIGLAVPSFTGSIRDVKIKEDYLALCATLSQERKYVILAQKYHVSKRKIIKVVKSTTVANATTHPSLFDV